MTRDRLSQSLGILIFLWGVSACENNPPPHESSEPKQAPPASITVPREQALYNQNGCVACHGKYGEGVITRSTRERIPDLRNKKDYLYGATKKELIHTLKNGIPDTKMRSYGHLKDDEMESIARYLIELQKIRD